MGVIYTSNVNGLIYNNVICNNYGCGIFDGHQLSTTRIFNNTIVNNDTPDGAISIGSKAQIYNNICWGNAWSLTPNHDFDQIYIYMATQGRKLFNNCVQFGDGGAGSINSIPEFVHISNGVGLAYNGS